MGNIGDSISTSVPTVGSAGPAFATSINAILTEVVARLTTKVPLGSINFSSALDLAGSDILNVSNITFTNLSGAPSGSPFNRFAAFAGNLYWVSNVGALQITNGASLNAAALAGITGDYGGANPAQFRYDAATTRYNAYADFAGGTWAYVRALGFDIAAGATSSVFARILFAGGSNVTFTLPATVPAANQLLSLDNSGNITAGTSAALAANANITLSGTGVLKHGTKQINRVFNWHTYVNRSGSIPTDPGGGHMGANITSGDNAWQLPELPTHCRILAVTVTYDSALSRSHCTATLYSTSAADPATLTMTSVGALSNSGTARQTLGSLTLSPGSGQTYWIGISGDATGGNAVNMIVDWDIP